MLIDETFFNGLMNIPNIAEPEPNNRSANILSELIDISEEEVLSLAFGREMWDDFKQNWETDEFYQKIVNGDTYQKDGKTHYWKGLIYGEYSNRSLLADYVYCRYHTHNVTQQTEFGQVAADTKIGQKASSTPKITKAWNSFLTQFQGGRFNGGDGLTPEGNPYWIIARRLGNGYGVSYYNGSQGGEVSLLQYLSDNKENFPLLHESRGFGLEFKNSFGI